VIFPNRNHKSRDAAEYQRKAEVARCLWKMRGSDPRHLLHAIEKLQSTGDGKNAAGTNGSSVAPPGAMASLTSIVASRSTPSLNSLQGVRQAASAQLTKKNGLNAAVDVERLSITLAIGKSRLEAAVDQGSVKEGNVRLDHDPKAGDDRLEILVAVAP
jgi:hypothetical protein